MKNELKPPPYNPLDKSKLGESVANALLESPLRLLPPEPFLGAGVYAIYYMGDFPSYGVLARETPPSKPIYVGKAVPKGARKGHVEPDVTSGDTLFQRLKEHADSVEEVGLGRTNFRCRYLVVDDIWIPLGESLLIRRFRPVWNVLLDGFGNHDPGGKRVTGKTSRWDMVHPGRSWVKKRRLQPNPKSRDEWLNEIEKYLSTGESADLVMEESIPYSESDEA
jgi:hypothetical protein